jgi:hypothetical protein
VSRGKTPGAEEAYRILVATLRGVYAGERWTMDAWREQADLAQLSSREKARAHERACEDGYLVALGAVVGGVFHTFSIRSTHKAGHGRRVIVYARTTKSLPGQPAMELHHEHHSTGQVEGQANLLELVKEEGVTV